MNRREFVKVGSLVGMGAVAVSSGFMLEGCSLVGDIESWVPVGITALKGIVTVLGANGVTLLPGVVTVFNVAIAALNALLKAAQAYAATTPAPVGTLQTLEAAFAAVTSSIDGFLTALNLPGGGLLTTIVALAQVIFSAIAGFVNKLPVASTTLGAAHHVGAVSFTVVPNPKLTKRGAFKKTWNSALNTAAAVGVNCPPSAYLTLTMWEHL